MLSGKALARQFKLLSVRTEVKYSVVLNNGRRAVFTGFVNRSYCISPSYLTVLLRKPHMPSNIVG